MFGRSATQASFTPIRPPGFATAGARLTSGMSDQDFRPVGHRLGLVDAAAMQATVRVLPADVSRTPAVVGQSREPAWSGYLTRPMARWLPARWRRQTLTAIKGIHTAIFGSVFAAVVLTLWDGLRGRPTSRTAIAGAVVLAESVLYVSNNQVCPLTPLAEEFGAERGSVVDLFLPAAVARRIPLVAGSTALAALALNARALLRRSANQPAIRTPSSVTTSSPAGVPS